MTVRRPKRSDRALIGSTNSASPPVAAATVQLAVARRHPELAGDQREQRLRGVQQREGRHTCEEEGEAHPAVAGPARGHA
ncbi:hypothetical protein SVIOM74S_10564 [Streptomyces violarus]